MVEFKIGKVEKGIPIPSFQKIYPFDKLTVGDSFMIKCSNKDAPLIRRRVSSAATNFSNHSGVKNFKLSVRAVEGGIRAWRIK